MLPGSFYFEGSCSHLVNTRAQCSVKNEEKSRKSKYNNNKIADQSILIHTCVVSTIVCVTLYHIDQELVLF